MPEQGDRRCVCLAMNVGNGLMTVLPISVYSGFLALSSLGSYGISEDWVENIVCVMYIMI